RQPSTPTPLLTRRGRSQAAEAAPLSPPATVPTENPTDYIFPPLPASPTTPTPTAAFYSDDKAPSIVKESSSSDDDQITALSAQPNRSLAYLSQSRAKDRMSTTAQVVVLKIRDCPTLTSGTINPLILQNWYHACRRFAKQSGKDPKTEVVRLVADAMLEPRLQNWYVTQMDRIDKLSLDEYIAELSAFALDKNWAHHTKQQIHSVKQPENSRFVDWRIKIENLNAILNTSTKTFTLSEGALRDVLEANTRASLAVSLANKPIDASLSYQEWSDEVHSRDQELRDEEKHMVAKLIHLCLSISCMNQTRLTI
ncbi:hypothetical protein BJ912DRAFT_860671, partial [Pholiota molesta]